MPPRLLKLVKSGRALATNSAKTTSTHHLNQSETQACKTLSSHGKLTSLEREFLPPLLEIQETPPSPLRRGVLWTILGVSAALVAWACIGEISIVSTAPGKVVPDGRIKVIQPIDSAIVKSIHIKEGQHVLKGQLLIELDPTISGADLTSNSDRYILIQLELARLQGELSGRQSVYGDISGNQPELIELQERLRAARESAHLAKLSEARNDLKGKEHALAGAISTKIKLEEMTKIAREKESRINPHIGVVISRFDYLKLKDDLNQNENDLLYHRKKVEELRETTAAAEQKVRMVKEENRARLIADIAEKTNLLYGLKADVEKSRQMVMQKELRSPVDGIINSLEVATVGGVVNPAQTLMTIVPDDMPILIEAALENEDVGYVKVNQPVDLKIDTFPFQKYGVIPGRVASISPDIDDRLAANGKTANSSGNGLHNMNQKKETAYRVLIRPDITTIKIGNSDQPISVGMTVKADISTDKRKIVDFFISPIVHHLDNGLKSR